MADIYVATIPSRVVFIKPDMQRLTAPAVKTVSEAPRDFAWLARRLPIFAKMVSETEETRRSTADYKRRYLREGQ